MRYVGLLIAIVALGCATAGPRWVRADGSPGDPKQLEQDAMTCFPDPVDLGEGTSHVARRNAEACMRDRGWGRPSS